MTASTAKPVIGLSAYAEPARWAVWNSSAVLLPLAYAEQVAAAGGIPVLLPPVAGIEIAAGRLDGLVLTGGGDIDPTAYGAEPHPLTDRVSQDRDRAELGLLAAGLAAGLPVLGICRGLQILNVARGGTLHQHLPDAPGLDGLAAHTPTPGSYGSHPVRISPGSKLATILAPDNGHGSDGHGSDGHGSDGPGTLQRAVPTSHHQAIDRLGDGLTATAWAADGVIEAVELGVVSPGQHPFVLAVQWHPEVGDDPRLFQALIAAASTRSAPRPRELAPTDLPPSPPPQALPPRHPPSWHPLTRRPRPRQQRVDVTWKCAMPFDVTSTLGGEPRETEFRVHGCAIELL